jgi:hypothetical protein
MTRESVTVQAGQCHKDRRIHVDFIEPVPGDVVAGVNCGSPFLWPEKGKMS